jgi:hypothetical protein
MTDAAPQSPVPAWGSATTALDLPLHTPDLDAARAVDRLLIQELVARYCWSYDERRLDALAASYTADAVWDGSVAGEFAIDDIVGREAIVDWLKGHMAAQSDQRRHNVLNTIFTKQGPDSAQLISYLLLTGTQDRVTSVITSGFYRVDVVKTGEGWQIKRIFGGFDNAF